MLVISCLLNFILFAAIIVLVADQTQKKKQVVDDREVFDNRNNRRRICDDFIKLTITERMKKWHGKNFKCCRIDNFEAIYSGRRIECLCFLQDEKTEKYYFSMTDIAKTPNPLSTNIEGALYTLMSPEAFKKPEKDYKKWAEKAIQEIQSKVETAIKDQSGFFVSYIIPDNYLEEEYENALKEQVVSYGWTPILKENVLKVNFQNNM